MGKGRVMPCSGSLGSALLLGMPLNVINQGPFHPAKAASHFCGFWLPAQRQALTTPPLPEVSRWHLGLPTSGDLCHMATYPCLLFWRPCFSLNWRALEKCCVSSTLSSLGKKGLDWAAAYVRISDSSQGHDSSRHKGNSSFGYYLCLRLFCF